jgi:hypothetical protein
MRLVKRTSRGWQCARTASISRGARRAFAITGHAPRLLVAKSEATSAVQFSPTIITRSPAPMPAARRAAAAASIRAARAA